MASTKILYIVITKNCMLSCPFCFNRFVDNFSKCAPNPIDVDLVMSTIDKIHPEIINFIGGEPLLYPETMLDIMKRYTESNKNKIFWCLSTNLFYKELSDKQIECLQYMQNISLEEVTIGTSYSTDRFKDVKGYKEIFLNNMDRLDDLGIRIGVTVTLTEDLIDSTTPEELYKKMISIKAKAINLEREIHGEEGADNKALIKQYEKSDEYMKECFKIIPQDMNYQYKRFYDAAYYGVPVFCNDCSSSVFTLYDHGLFSGCPLNNHKSNNKDVLANKKSECGCYTCQYYFFCKGDCECNRQPICSFPKKTMDYMLHVVKIKAPRYIYDEQ